MNSILIDPDRLVKCIAFLSHKEIDRSEFTWLVAYHPQRERSRATIQLPARINSVGGFQSLRDDDHSKPESDAGERVPNTASPFEFVDLDPSFSWSGPIPEMNNDDQWSEEGAKEVLATVRSSLREQVTLDGKRYRVEYKDLQDQ